jgi:uncharacterized protein involved in exopolysaccharide biosynthesis
MNSQIDLIESVKKIFRSRRIVILYVMLGALIGVGISLGLKNEFSAGSTFIVQSESSTGVPGNLGGLASLAGIKLNEGSTNNIPVLAFPKLLTNAEFLSKILNSKITVEKGSNHVTYRDYFMYYHEPSLVDNILKYSIGLPGEILKLLKSEEITSEKDSSYLFKFSHQDFELIKRIPNRLSMQIDEDTGLITISFLMPDARQAAEMASHAEKILQDYLVDFRSKGAKDNLKFLSKELNRVDSLFKIAQVSLADFKDKNQVLTTNRSQIEILRLQSDYDLTSALRSELAAQWQDAKIQVSKNTPVFSVVSPVTIPNEKIKPRRAIIVILVVMFSFVISILHILFYRQILAFFKEITAK